MTDKAPRAFHSTGRFLLLNNPEAFALQPLEDCFGNHITLVMLDARTNS